MTIATVRNRWLRRAVIGAFAATITFATATTSLAAEPELVMRIGITTSADSILGQEVDHFAKLLDLNTDGRIQAKLFPNGLLGKENTELEGMVAGTHDAFIHISSYTGLIKEQRFWDLPFLFPDGDAVARVTEGPLRAEMEEQFRKYGLELLAFYGFGYRQFTGNVRPYDSPEDLKGIKHRIPGGKSKTILFKALGADPSTVSFPELYQALKAGVVDSQDNPLSLIYSAKLYEVTKYLSVCNYIYNPVIFAVGQPFWGKVPAWAKPIIKQAARDTEGWSTMLSEKIDVVIMQKIMQEKPDYQVNYCDQKNLPKWQEAAKPVYEAFVDDAGKEWAEKIFAVAGGKYAPGYDPSKR